MTTTLDTLQQNILDYISNFIYGGKICTHLLFPITAQDFYASDVFNERELVAILEQHASVVIDSGRTMRVWRETVINKYGNLPGIRVLHDFLALLRTVEAASADDRAEGCKMLVFSSYH